jgi:hypothetical protein
MFTFPAGAGLVAEKPGSNERIYRGGEVRDAVTVNVCL